MEMLDIFALFGLEWAYDWAEDRYGRTAALVVTSGLALALIAALIAVLIALI
jgi:hypothetical protein